VVADQVVGVVDARAVLAFIAGEGEDARATWVPPSGVCARPCRERTSSGAAAGRDRRGLGRAQSQLSGLGVAAGLALIVAAMTRQQLSPGLDRLPGRHGTGPPL